MAKHSEPLPLHVYYDIIRGFKEPTEHRIADQRKALINAVT